MSDRHVRRGGDDYWQALTSLLPQGQAWPTEPASTLQRCVRGLAQVFGFVDSRAADLLERESDPRTTIELLPEWERAWGLPDPCFTVPQSIADRQRWLVKRMTLMGGQSRAWFQEVADEIGYPLKVREYSPFMAGMSRVGDTRHLDDGEHYRWQVGSWTQRFFWTTAVTRASITWFRASRSQAGVDPHVRVGIAEDQQCLFDRWKPAHTIIVYDFTNLEFGDSMAGTP